MRWRSALRLAIWLACFDGRWGGCLVCRSCCTEDSRPTASMASRLCLMRCRRSSSSGLCSVPAMVLPRLGDAMVLR